MMVFNRCFLSHVLQTVTEVSNVVLKMVKNMGIFLFFNV